MNLDRSEWQSAIDAVEGRPTVNQLAQALVDSEAHSPVDIGSAADLVEAAIEDDILDEDPDAPGMFPVVRVSDRQPPEEVATDDEPSLDTVDDHRDDQISEATQEAFVDAIEFFHSRIDDPLPESCGLNADTPREYFHNRGWDDDTIEKYKLGYAPASDAALVNQLIDYDREAILGTGLFWENNFAPIWKGRVVLPYLVDDEPTFAISREIGHPDDDAGVYGEDDDPAKYHKIPGQDCTAVEEPIFGLDSIEPGEPLVITEGIADAITAQQAGYPAVSPVTTRFKHEDREDLVDALGEHDILRIYIVQDAEPPTSDLADGADGWDALSIEQFGEGLRGAVDTGAYLADHGIDAHVAELPRPGLDKVDLDDYLHDWSDGDLGAVLASAKPATEHDAHDPREHALERAHRDADREVQSSSNGSALYDLSILDVTGLDESYRGPNPLGHHGDSENYYTFYERNGDVLGFDHKYKSSYNALTHLLVEAGDRFANDPYGSLDDQEHFAAWAEAKRQGVIPSDDPVPYRAICHVVRDHGLAPDERIPTPGETDSSLPAEAYNQALELVDEEYGLDPGRDPVEGAQGHAHEHDVDPLSLDVVIDVGLAHRAVEHCLPRDLEDDADALAGVTPVDGEGWIPEGAPDTRTNVVRATLLSEGAIDSWDADLDADTWTRGYRLARERYGAPLPEYVNHSVATDRWATIEGAVEALRSWHVQDGMHEYCTVDDPSGPDTVAVYDFEDSESGERLVEFASGLYYCREHDRVVDPLRAVAVQEAIIPDCQAGLGGDDFQAAYHAAREEYGAPLPEWRVGDPSHTVLLPPADEVLGEVDVDADALQDVREEHEDLLEDLSRDYRTTHLDTSAPGTGKTTGVVKNAAQRDQPILYGAPRLELMKEVEETAREYGASYYHAPIFARSTPRDGVIESAVQAVREHEDGFELLEDTEVLLDVLEIDPEDIEPGTGGPKSCDGCGEGFETLTGIRTHECPQKAGDQIDLRNPDGSGRATCQTASGPSGDDPDEEDLMWWLRVHVARSLGFTPKEIHVHDEWLFGETLPCQHDHDEESGVDGDQDSVAMECALSRAWDRIADPERPIDVVIGQYVHAHVESARTYYCLDEDENTDTEPRTVVIDEFPGDAFAVEFGEEAVEHARWLGTCLREDVSSTQDLWMASPPLGDDDRVDAWLDGAADEPERWSDTAQLIDTLDDLREFVDAFDEIQNVSESAIDDVRRTAPPFADAIEAVRAGPGVSNNLRLVDRVTDLQNALQSAANDPRFNGTLIEDLDHAAGVIACVLDDHGVTPDVGTPDTLEEALGGRPEPFAGDLADLVENGIQAALDAADGASNLLWSARQAARGGETGCRELAAHARDGYAHPLAFYLLAGAVQDGEAIETDSFSFADQDDDAGEPLTQVDISRSTVLWSRDHTGALVNHPPSFESKGLDCSVVGLDATGRDRLWSLALGRPVIEESVHDGDKDKRRFLRETMNLQVVQTSNRLRTYEGAPSGSFDGDVGLVREVSREYTKEFLREGRLDQATMPGVITSKTVRQEIEPRIQDDISAIDHYGNILGSNELAQCNIGVVLGTQHFGDDTVEMWASLAGEEVARSGRGNDLDYGSRVGNEVLNHMTEDQTLQAIMRFGRDEAGAVVFAHTSALREDLPVVGCGAVVRTYSRTGHAVAKTLKGLRNETFTRADVEERLDDGEASKRQVRRVLEEFVEAGYLDRDERGGPHGAHLYKTDGVPTDLANTLLPTPETRNIDDPNGGEDADRQPDKLHTSLDYTANVRLDLDGDVRDGRSGQLVTVISAPDNILPVEPRYAAGDGSG